MERDAVAKVKYADHKKKKTVGRYLKRSKTSNQDVASMYNVQNAERRAIPSGWSPGRAERAERARENEPNSQSRGSPAKEKAH